jgi:hypothetical protein
MLHSPSVSFKLPIVELYSSFPVLLGAGWRILPEGVLLRARDDLLVVGVALLIPHMFPGDDSECLI